MLFCTSSSRAFMPGSRPRAMAGRGLEVTLKIKSEATTGEPVRRHALALLGRGGAVALWLAMAVWHLPERPFGGLPHEAVGLGGAVPGYRPSFRHDCVLFGRPAFYRTAEPAEKVIQAFTATTIKHEHH